MNRTLAEEVYLVIWQSEAATAAAVAVVVVLALALLIIGSLVRFLVAALRLTTESEQQQYDNANDVVETQRENKLKDITAAAVVVAPSGKEVGKRRQQRVKATKDVGLSKRV
jgi:flagellar biosynthesis/type III secretory pathway M-ring protein FliF/YscJ